MNTDPHTAAVRLLELSGKASGPLNVHRLDDGALMLATTGDCIAHTDPNHGPDDPWDAATFAFLAFASNHAPAICEALLRMEAALPPMHPTPPAASALATDERRYPSSAGHLDHDAWCREAAEAIAYLAAGQRAAPQQGGDKIAEYEAAFQRNYKAMEDINDKAFARIAALEAALRQTDHLLELCHLFRGYTTGPATMPAVELTLRGNKSVLAAEASEG